MPGHWHSYFKWIDEHPASVAYAHGIGDYLAQSDKNRLTLVTLELSETDEKGFPAPGECPRLDDFDRELIEQLDWDRAAYVGRVFYRGLAKYAFFDNEQENRLESMVRSLAESRDFPVEVEQREDPTADYYWGFLYPGEMEMHTIRNRLVLERLQAEGDALEEERPIEHSCDFPNEEQREAFRQWVEEEGFQVDRLEVKELSSPVDLHTYSITFSHLLVPELPKLHEVTFFLYQKSLELGGHYQGWQTELLPSR